jgi:hypothetical protein
MEWFLVSGILTISDMYKPRSANDKIECRLIKNPEIQTPDFYIFDSLVYFSYSRLFTNDHLMYNT